MKKTRIRFLILFSCIYMLLIENIMQVEAATLTHNPRYKRYDIEYGIDVSYHQGEIDWEKVKKTGVRFAFIRVARRTLDGGSLGMDARAIENIEGATKAGISVGVYIFSQAISQKEAIEEADYIMKAIEPYREKITLPVVLDYEYADMQGNRGRLEKAIISRKNATNICLAFCNAVKEAGYKPMVYSGKDILTNDLNADRIAKYYPIWLAHYDYETDYMGDYSYWQYSSNGSIPGIEGRVDLNVRYIAPTDSDYRGIGEETVEFNEYVSTFQEQIPTGVFILVGVAVVLVLVMAGIVIGVLIKEKIKNGN